jgi:fumarate hydratase class II
MSQSSNDSFPTVIHYCLATLVREELEPALDRWDAVLEAQGREFMAMIKIGRTHLQNAMPVTFGQEWLGKVNPTQCEPHRAILS